AAREAPRDVRGARGEIVVDGFEEGLACLVHVGGAGREGEQRREGEEPREHPGSEPPRPHEPSSSRMDPRPRRVPRSALAVPSVRRRLARWTSIAFESGSESSGQSASPSRDFEITSPRWIARYSRSWASFAVSSRGLPPRDVRWATVSTTSGPSEITAV